MQTPSVQETVEIHLEAKGLPKLDVFSNSDPFAILYAVQQPERRKVQIACTVTFTFYVVSNLTITCIISSVPNITQEVIVDSQNPKWATGIKIPYSFEVVQEFIVEVYDKDDGPITDLSRHQKCGETSFKLSSLMCAKNQRLTQSLRGGYATGSSQLLIFGEIVANIRDEFECTFAGSKLANKDGWFGTSDPFLEISKIREDGDFVNIFRNNPIMNNLSPTWPIIKIPIQKLCNGDIDRPIRIDIFDWDKGGTHEIMGGVQTSVRGLQDSRGKPFNVIEDSKKSKKGYVNSGTLIAINPIIRHKPCFLDFLRGGCEISMSVAIDFTGSNGHPSMPNSLHYLDPTGQVLNQYQQAIISIGGLLEEYDSDKIFPLYGFGGQVLTQYGTWGPVSHCFPVSPYGWEVNGVSGIFQAYKDSLQRISLSGPTLFGPLISAATQTLMSKGGCTQTRQHYEVLMILTDGIINDMMQTIDNIVAATPTPMSIIIIGVGNADFTDMRLLDGDEQGLVSSSGRRGVRDIVQFVRFVFRFDSYSIIYLQRVDI